MAETTLNNHFKMSIHINIFHHRPAVAEALKLCLHYSNYENIEIFTTTADLLGSFDQLAINLVDSFLFPSFYSEQKELLPFSLLVTSDNDSNIIEAFYAGARSFINVSKGPAHFINHVEQMTADKLDESSQLIRHFLIDKSPQNSPKEEEHKLTKKESEILKLMREGQHLKLIAQNTDTTYETVRTHVKHIYKKLGVASASEAVIKAMKMSL